MLNNSIFESFTEKKTFKPIINSILQLFEKWNINLINILSTVSNNNKWIIIVINYATTWSIVKIIKNAKIEIIVEFLHGKIFQHYKTWKELLLNNKINLLKR